MKRIAWIVAWGVIATLHGLGAGAQADTPAPAEASPEAGAQEQTRPYQTAPPPEQPGLEGIKVDREAGHIDLDAKVVLRDGQWLELLACTPGTREHESILTVAARPRDIHLALILLGLEPGSPLKWERLENREVKVHPPTGPKVNVTLHYEEDDENKTVDANQWIVNQQDGTVMQGNTWLFAGSRFETFDDRQVYMADPNGSVLSLVNFGDDVLARNTKVTRDNDEKAWNANTPVIPEVGTEVTIRLKPVDPPKQEDAPAQQDAQPATDGDENADAPADDARTQ